MITKHAAFDFKVRGTEFLQFSSGYFDGWCIRTPKSCDACDPTRDRTGAGKQPNDEVAWIKYLAFLPHTSNERFVLRGWFIVASWLEIVFCVFCVYPREIERNIVNQIL